MLYKIVNYKVEIELCDISTQIVDRTTRRGAKLGTDVNQKRFLPSAKSTNFRKSFAIRTIPEWNKLQVDILQSSSLEAFKSKLDVLQCP